MFVVGSSRHHHLEFIGRDGVSAAAVASASARIPDVVGDGVHVVVGFSGDLWAAVAPAPAPAPVPFPALDRVPATPGDVWVWLHGSDAGDLFDALRAVTAALAPVATLSHEIDGWVYHDLRDLTGFIDGTENPAPEEQATVALVPAGEPGAGGSYALTQTWEHDLDAFAALPVDEQERVFGRTKPDSVELDDDVRPATAHISRVVITEDGEELEVYRRSVPYGDARVAGLHFVGFSARPDILPRMLGRMFGDDGPRDRLTDFSTPVTGNHWFVPALDDLTALVRP